MNKTAKTLAYYTNETTNELLQKLNEPHFSEEDIAAFDASAAEVVRKNQAHDIRHPVIGIRRVATVGSQSKGGGKIANGSLNLTIALKNGEKVKAARIGDLVKYPDGSTARIITGAGTKFGDVALVGSRLDNGDEIINTPQDTSLLAIRKDFAYDSDFLPDAGDE